MRRPCIVAALLTAAAVSVTAQAPALDVRMGYWEFTSTVTMSGMPPMDTSRMSSAQKAQMEATMQAMAGPHTSTDNSCVKPEDFNRQALFMGQEDTEDCKQTITLNTRTTLEGTIACTGDNQMTGKVRIDAASPTTMKASMQGSSVRDGKTIAVSLEMSGRFLAATCPKN